MASAGLVLMDTWDAIARGYRRPQAWFARRLGFAFFPLLALVMVAGLVWDWQGPRHLDAAEDALFDRIISLRPWEPVPSGRTVVVEIDDCSIGYYRARGEGGWPWSRERHADLIDALDQAGVRAVGVDVLFVDRATDDPEGDALLEAVVAAGEGRFVVAASRLHPDFDAASGVPASTLAGAIGLAGGSAPAPAVAVLQPFGDVLSRYSGLVNVQRADDGLLRDVLLYQRIGDWALPSLPLRLAQAAGADASELLASPREAMRINWRKGSRLPYVSAADLLEQRPVCGSGLPSLHGAVAVVGHTAAGINDVKPTPVDMATPGVEVLAEATEALLAGTWIRMPPGWLKYAVAIVLVLLSAFVFWRGEPQQDLDPVFVVLNLVLIVVAFSGLVLRGWFVDIFASLGYGTLCFALCRSYAGVQRGLVTGNSDYLPEYDPDAHPRLLVARLRFEADPALTASGAKRRRREYRRLMRRFTAGRPGIVVIEGVVERKHWLQAILDDVLTLVWSGAEEQELQARARRDLADLHAALNASDERLDGGGRVMVCTSAASIDGHGATRAGRRLCLRELLGQDFNRLPEWPLGHPGSPQPP